MNNATAEVNLAGKRVLVIDDDQVARNLISNHLERLGASDLVLKEDGEAGWDTITKEVFDLVILDWKLPRLSSQTRLMTRRGRTIFRRCLR